MSFVRIDTINNNLIVIRHQRYFKLKVKFLMTILLKIMIYLLKPHDSYV